MDKAGSSPQPRKSDLIADLVVLRVELAEVKKHRDNLLIAIREDRATITRLSSEVGSCQAANRQGVYEGGLMKAGTDWEIELEAEEEKDGGLYRRDWIARQILNQCVKATETSSS